MPNEIEGELEFPNNYRKIYWGIMIVKGWVFSKKSSNVSIEIYIDGNLIDMGRWGLPRFDIFKIFNSEKAYESGFIARVGVRSLTDGFHSVEVLAKSPYSEKLLGKIKVKIGKKEANDKVIPRENVPVGRPGAYKEWGQKYLHYFVELANLKPSHKVLEIGCGLGKMSLPLTKFLKNEGVYYAIDPIPEAIRFCQENISTRYSNFHFLVADVYNKMYNPKATKKACEYKFPLEDKFFDFIFLASVFTHMVLKDVENYISEIARVLKTGKCCFSTFFLTNTQNFQENKLNSSRLDFKHKFNGYTAIDSKIPEQAIAFDERVIRELYEKYGLQIIEPIHYRQGVKNPLSFQDIIIATKM